MPQQKKHEPTAMITREHSPQKTLHAMTMTHMLLHLKAIRQHA